MDKDTHQVIDFKAEKNRRCGDSAESEIVIKNKEMLTRALNESRRNQFKEHVVYYISLFIILAVHFALIIVSFYYGANT